MPIRAKFSSKCSKCGGRHISKGDQIERFDNGWAAVDCKPVDNRDWEEMLQYISQTTMTTGPEIRLAAFYYTGFEEFGAHETWDFGWLVTDGKDVRRYKYLSNCMEKIIDKNGWPEEADFHEPDRSHYRYKKLLCQALPAGVEEESTRELITKLMNHGDTEVRNTAIRLAAKIIEDR